jgi:hypothetical protein
MVMIIAGDIGGQNAALIAIGMEADVLFVFDRLHELRSISAVAPRRSWSALRLRRCSGEPTRDRRRASA